MLALTSEVTGMFFSVKILKMYFSQNITSFFLLFLN